MHQLLVISLNGDPLAELGREHAGGQCRYVLEITKRLAGYGWSSAIFTIGSAGTEVCGRVGAALSVWRVKLEGGLPYNPDACLDQIDAISREILRIISEQSIRVDVVLACYWLSGLAALSVAAALSKRTVMSFCSLGVYKQSFAGASAMARRIAIERDIASRVDHIIAASLEEAGTLKSEYQADARKISIIPRGIDLDVFRPRA